jgi:hypothetical protein
VLVNKSSFGRSNSSMRVNYSECGMSTTVPFKPVWGYLCYVARVFNGKKGPVNNQR